MKFILYLFNLSGRLFKKITIRATGDLIVGNFFGLTPGDEVAVKNGSSFQIVNPFRRVSATVLLTAQVPVDEININALSAWGGSSGGGSTSCAEKNPKDGSIYLALFNI